MKDKNTVDCIRGYFNSVKLKKNLIHSLIYVITNARSFTHRTHVYTCIHSPVYENCDISDSYLRIAPHLFFTLSLPSLPSLIIISIMMCPLSPFNTIPFPSHPFPNLFLPLNPSSLPSYPLDPSPTPSVGVIYPLP